MKPLIERKSIQDALENKYPLFWERHWREFQLHAVTYAWENGTVRTKKVFTQYVASEDDLEIIRKLHNELDSIDAHNLFEVIEGYYEN